MSFSILDRRASTVARIDGITKRHIIKNIAQKVKSIQKA
jgi:hypothetical protein